MALGWSPNYPFTPRRTNRLGGGVSGRGWVQLDTGFLCQLRHRLKYRYVGFSAPGLDTPGGKMWTWNHADDPAPVAVTELGPMTAIAGDGELSAALARDGRVWV